MENGPTFAFFSGEYQGDWAMAYTDERGVIIKVYNM
jgi:hypothetical protein